MAKPYLLLPLLIASQTLFAASFDCAKAGTAVEKMICVDEQVSKLDSDLSAAYKVALDKTDNKDQLKQEQVKWLKERNQCSTADCLNQSYEARVTALTANAPKAVAEAPKNDQSNLAVNSKPIYKITKGKQFELCRVFNDYLNSQYYKPGDCHVGTYPPDPRLRSPEYKQVDADKYKDEIIKYKIKRYSDVPEMEAYTKKDFAMQLLHYWEVAMDLDSDGIVDQLLIERHSFKDKFKKEGCYKEIGSASTYLIEDKKISDSWGEYPVNGDPFWFDGKPYLLGNSAGYYIAEPNKRKEIEKSFPTTGVCEFSGN